MSSPPPAPHLAARIDSRNGVASVALTGELDLGTVPILEGHLAPFENDGVAAILVDLRDLTFTDTTGIRALIDATDRVITSGRRLILVDARPFVRSVFRLTGTERLLDNRDAAGVLHRFAAGTAGAGGEAADVDSDH
jgi:anti-sigma B factor antagonist/stage II sporulation protein AA (anti-sigma F factor antagonist)